MAAMNRRGFLGAILAAGVAPAIIPMERLMKPVTPSGILAPVGGIMRVGSKLAYRAEHWPDVVYGKSQHARSAVDTQLLVSATLFVGDIIVLSGLPAGQQQLVVTKVHSGGIVDVAPLTPIPRDA